MQPAADDRVAAGAGSDHGLDVVTMRAVEADGALVHALGLGAQPPCSDEDGDGLEGEANVGAAETSSHGPALAARREPLAVTIELVQEDADDASARVWVGPQLRNPVLSVVGLIPRVDANLPAGLLGEDVQDGEVDAAVDERRAGRPDGERRVRGMRPSAGLRCSRTSSS